MGKGIGYVDAHLLAATAMDGNAKLWTRDKRLYELAVQLNLVAVL
jgi:predicted nucleic acid-binding protein